MRTRNPELVRSFRHTPLRPPIMPTHKFPSVLRAFVAALLFAPLAQAQQPDTLIYSIPSPATGSQSEGHAGTGVAIEGTFVVVGSPEDDTGEVDSGVVRIYNSNSNLLRQTLVNPSPAQGDKFGYSVAISGTYVVVGAPGDDFGSTDAGSAYVYDLASDTPTVPIVTLRNPTPGPPELFGKSVAISGSRVVVGTPEDDFGNVNVGRVYVYDVSSATPATPVATLSKPSPASDEFFGDSVAILGTRIIVGAPSVDAGATKLNAGAAYVYDLTSATPLVPILTLNNPDPESDDLFGDAVAITSTRAVVGCSKNRLRLFNSPTGSAYVYDLASATPGAPVVTLDNPSPNSGDAFGSTVAMQGTRVVVGAWSAVVDSIDAGCVYVYHIATATPTVPSVTLKNPVPANDDRFGFQVALAGDQIVVGAPYDDTGAADAGTAYRFDLTWPTPTTPLGTLYAPGPSSLDFFGRSVAISGSTVAVGADNADYLGQRAGEVYVYNLSSQTPTTPRFFISNPDPDSGYGFGNAVATTVSNLAVGAPFSQRGRVYLYDIFGGSPLQRTPIINPSQNGSAFFGAALAISGSRLVVGAPDHGSGGVNECRAYVYDVGGTSPTVPIAVLDNPVPGVRTLFGTAVAISGTRVVIGAPWYNSDRGIAYVYDLSSGTPTTPIMTINNPTPASGDMFGYSVAIEGNRVVVGSAFDNAPFTDAGCVHVFDVSGAAPVLTHTLNNPAPSPAIGFAYKMGLSGTRIIVGNTTGGAYVFDLSSPSPLLPVATLTNPTSKSTDNFGSSVAIGGSIAIVGAPGADTPQADKGAFYVFGPDASYTRQPTLIEPVERSVFANSIDVSFTLPEAALAGSVQIQFSGPSATRLNLANALTSAGNHSFTFDTANPSASPAVSSVTGATSLPDGNYTVTLSYRDAAGNAVNSAAAPNVRIDRVGPTIGSFDSEVRVIATSATGAEVTFTLAGATDPIGVASVTASPPSGATFPVGKTVVTITATDLVDNSSTASFIVNVRPMSPVNATVIAQGDIAPGAGTETGPPAGAKLVSFGVPAIDAEGHIAFAAKWKGKGGGGGGIFLDDKCLAKTGGAVPGLPDAKFRTFKDPVIDAGRVAFIATIAGVRGSNTVVMASEAGTGQLELIAQAGTAAPGAGDAKFKLFKSVAISRNSVGVLAKLGGGTGTNRTTVTNDWGLWVKRLSDPLAMTFRESLGTEDGYVLDKLTTLVSGKDSPGQGRGWLLDDGDTARVLAHATLTNGAQAIVALDDLTTLDVLTFTGAVDGLGYQFAGLGLPAANASQSAFRGFVLVPVSSTSSAAVGGVFADRDADGIHEPMFYVNGDTGYPDVVFSGFGDPVLAADGGLAVAATVKGPPIEADRRTANTLLWRAPEAPVWTLLAQAGAGLVLVPGVPGAQWKSFPSLAIASTRGPIFLGTLVPGRGGVTKPRANGAWAVDFQGTLHLLFQSGVTKIDGRTLRKFTLLNASPGSEGSTRSFNDDGFVVWRALFTDGKQAIVRTEIP